MSRTCHCWPGERSSRSGRTRAIVEEFLSLFRLVVFGDGKGAGENDLIVNLDENRIVAGFFELQAVDVVDQIDPVMGTGGFEIPFDYDPGLFLGHGQPD